nr:hypothetical protein [Cereibacter changlensis]
MRETDVVERLLRPEDAAQRAGRLADQIIEPRAAHDAGDLADLVGAGEIDDDGEARLALAVAGQIGEVIAELVAAGQAAHRVDAAEGVLQLDLRHDHRREIDQRRHLGGRGLPRLGPQHAERAEAEALAGDQRRPGVEPRPVAAERAVGIERVRQQVVDHDRRPCLGHLGAGGPVARDAQMLDPDPRLEPLPVPVGQRDGGDRQAEDLAGHPGDAVEALAGGGVQQPELLEGIEPRVFCLFDHEILLRYRMANLH